MHRADTGSFAASDFLCNQYPQRAGHLNIDLAVVSVPLHALGIG